MDEFDIYGLMGSPEEEAKAKAMAIAQALRGQRDAGNLALLTGDRVLSGFGKAQLEQAGKMEALLGEAGQVQAGSRKHALALAMEQLQAQAKARAELEKEERQNAFNLKRDRLNDAAALGRAKVMAGQTAAQRVADRVDAERARKAEKEEDAKRKQEQGVMEIEDRYRNMKDAISTVRDMIEKQGGTNEFLGSHNAILEGKINSMATDAAKLRDKDSAAREGEVAMERKALPKIGASSLLGSDATALEVLKAFEDGLEQRRANAYRVRGLQPPGGEAEDGTKTSKRQEVKGRDGKLLGYINPDGSEELVP